MAEVILNTICTDQSIIGTSAGVSTTPQTRTSQNSAVVVMEKLGVNIENRCSVQLTSTQIIEVDLVFAMTESIKGVLLCKYPEYSSKVFTINEYVGVKGDVVDPYGGNVDVYIKTFNSLKNSINLLVNKFNEVWVFSNTDIFFFVIKDTF